MRSHWKPIFALLLITPFLTELLSGSLPASVFFRPQVFLFLATVGYGFPILLLREFAVRRQIGLAGLFVLGIVYGIFNEGIIAKTFYLAANVPVHNFNGYGNTGGIAVPWAITISIWHALHSLLYPVVAIYYFFPAHRGTPWLNRREIFLLAFPTAVLGMLIFFNHNKDREAGHPAHFILMVLTGEFLVWLSARLPAAPALGDDGRPQIPAIFLGNLGFLALVFVPVLLAGAKVPVLIFCGYHAALVVVIFRLLARWSVLPISTVLFFAVGDDTLLSLFGIGSAIGHGNIQKLVTSIVFLVIFVWLFARIRRSAG